MTLTEPLAEEMTSGPTVFISYRRDDTGDVARSLAEQLRKDLGSTNVFRDQDDLTVGDKWQERLSRALRDSDAALFLVGPHWLGPRADGSRRIDEPDDPVRTEVVAALDADNGAAPLPFLIDRDNPPSSVPTEIDALFGEYHYAAVSRSSFEEPPGPDYQTVLVGVWNALRQQVPGGKLIIGDRGAMASLDALVAALEEAGSVEARHLSRFASGAYITSIRGTKKLKKRWPEVFQNDVIVVIDDDEPSDELRARLAAIAAHPGIRAATLLSVGAATGAAIVSSIGADVGSTTTWTQSTAQVAGGVAQPAGASTSALSSAWASLGVTAKVVAVATATTLVVGSALALSELGGTDPAQFSESTDLPPVGVEVGAFPLGEPESVTVRLGSPATVSEEDSRAYFGNFPGGTAERRSIELEYGDARLDLGEVVVPVSYPSEFLERNVGTFLLTRVVSDGAVELIGAGVGAQSPCVYEGTGDTVGGWVYTGEPGVVTVDLLFESDGATVIDVGMRATFDGPADVVFFDDVVAEVIPEDIDLTDRCTPVDRLPSSWAAGAARAG